MVMSLGIVACLSTNCSKPEVSETTRDTLRGMAYVDMYAPTYTTQRPLLCGEGRHYPGGTDMVFKRSGQGGEVHAVFPKDVAVPSKGDLTTTLTLHGQFATIQSTPDGKAMDKPARPVKRIPYGYRYFVVSRWECEQ